MTIDKRISYDYVEQDGVNNYIKNSKSVTVPKEFKARKNAPATKLAYITADEAKMLKKKKPGTPHKGPKGIPSYDSFDAQGNFRSGEEMSAAERGDAGAFGRDPGARQEAQDIRSAAIAAGAGQRVNPSFFDSRFTVSPQEIRDAKDYVRNRSRFKSRSLNPGLAGLFTSGGILGNIIRSLGQRFGLGKTYDQPTYDMSQFSGIGLLADRINPNNLDIYNEFVDEEEDSTKRFTDTETLTDPNAQYLYNRDRILSGMNTFVAPPGQINYFPSQIDNTGINSLRLETPKQQAEDDFLKNAMADALTFPTDDGSGISLMNRSILRNAGYNDSQIKEAFDKGYGEQLIRDIQGPIGGSAFG